jgi:dimethylhistidine N-methyltransferase
MSDPSGGVVRFYDFAPAQDRDRAEILAGLGRPQKRIPSRFLYDARGRELLGRIGELPEYYLMRAETRILIECMGEIAAHVGPDSILVGFGADASQRTCDLLNALRPLLYVPVDRACDAVCEVSAALHAVFPMLNISGVCADFAAPAHLPEWSGLAYRRKAVFFPGPGIGEFTRGEAFDFLRQVRRLVGDGGAMLAGVDLVKDSRVLHAAYNDAQGLTAELNLNLLARINRELGADFRRAGFAHHAFYDAADGRVEMQLRSLRPQTVTIGGNVFDFREGETIRTLSACKYRVEEFQDLARRAGFNPERVWIDAEKLFSMHGLTAA